MSTEQQHFLIWHQTSDHERVSNCDCIRCQVCFEEFRDQFFDGSALTDYDFAPEIAQRYVWIFEIVDNEIVIEQRDVRRMTTIAYDPDVMKLIQSLGYCEA